MTLKIPEIKITAEQRIWMSSIYNKLLQGKQYSERLLRTELWGDIPPEFDPNEIDRRLLRGGDITLVGILLLAPDTVFLSLCDRVIVTIRDHLLEDPTFDTVTAGQLAEQLQVAPEDVGHALRLISHLGRFWTSASMHDSRVISANVGEAYREYFRYKGMDWLIREFCTPKDKKSNGFLENFHISSSTIPLDDDEEKVNSAFKVGYTPIFQTKVSEIDRKLCFVLMPFTQQWSHRVYTKLIRPTVESLGLQCLRADELNGQIVIEDIWVKINQCAFVIADVTNTNANVMYELGLVHTIGKPSILITQDFGTIPFDFTHLRHYGYSDDVDGFHELSEKLARVIPDIYKESYGVDLRSLVSINVGR